MVAMCNRNIVDTRFLEAAVSHIHSLFQIFTVVIAVCDGDIGIFMDILHIGNGALPFTSHQTWKATAGMNGTISIVSTKMAKPA